METSAILASGVLWCVHEGSTESIITPSLQIAADRSAADARSCRGSHRLLGVNPQRGRSRPVASHAALGLVRWIG